MSMTLRCSPAGMMEGRYVTLLRFRSLGGVGGAGVERPLRETPFTPASFGVVLGEAGYLATGVEGPCLRGEFLTRSGTSRLRRSSSWP